MDNPFVIMTALAAGLACVSAYLLTWLARVVAPRLGWIDRPDGGRKFHAKPTPLMGGVAVFISFTLCCIFIGPFVDCEGTDDMMLSRTLISGGLFCLLGLLDDKFTFRPRTKFLGQIFASLPFALGMDSIDSVEFLGLHLHLGIFGTCFKVFWIVACTNIVNLIDGLDGLASTIGMVAMVTIAVLSLITGTPTVAFLALVVAGSVVGFLIHNFPPAKIFLGDAGSLTIGFLAGALSLEASLKTAAVFTLTVPVVVLSVPTFDTFIAIVRRRLNGRRIGEADRGHIHHCLQDRGLTKLQTLLAIGALSVVMAGSAVLAAFFENDLIAAVACVLVLATVIASRLFGYHETLLVFWHAHALHELFVDSVGLVGTRFLLARAHSGDGSQRRQLWHHACQRLAKIGFTDVTVTGRRLDGDGTELKRSWANDHLEQPAASHWSVRYEVEREDGWLFSVRGEGLTPNDKTLPRSDDVFRIFQGICDHFAQQDDDVTADVLRFDREVTPPPLPVTVKSTDEGDSNRRAA